MTTIINADNGVSSGSAGLKSSADSSGVLQLQTNGTAALTVDASQNVGIGTTSPARKLTVKTGDGDGIGIQNSAGTEWRWAVNADSSFSAVSSGVAERMRIDSSGNVLVTNPAGLGYGTGSGGTVTQATSKSTAVTLNKPTGQITMNNAALAANTNVNFTLTNSTIASSADVIIVNDVSGMVAFGNYAISARAQGAGSAVISVRNVTAGSLSEAIVLSFAIIRGATS